MATVELRIHSDLTEDARPFEEALQFFADAAEGYFAYKMGDQDLNEQNYKAMLWAAAQLSGLVAQKRPVYQLGFNDIHDAEQEHLMKGSPYPARFL
tara:strand:- start:266 stop:553 length:288 start_codon:yes stop_codon:yes gene_type:complete